MIRFPAIDFDIVTASPDDVVFKTADPGGNVLTAVLTNAGDGDILLLAAGTAASAAIAFDFGDIVPTEGDASAGLLAPAITADGWALPSTAADGPLRPVRDIVWPKGANLTFAITGLKVGADCAAGPHDVAVRLTGAVDARDPKGRGKEKLLRAKVIVVVPPDPNRPRLADVLRCTLDPASVMCWTRSSDLPENGLTLAISNILRDDPLLPYDPKAAATPGDPDTETGTPTFTIAFATVPMPADPQATRSGYGRKALTYPDLCEAIEIYAVGDDEDHAWEVHQQVEYLSWEVKPSAGNHELMGPGGALVLQIGNVLSPLPPFATRIYLLYSHIGSYGSGYITIPLLKEEPQPRVCAFWADPSEVRVGDGSTLHWKTVGADYLKLTYGEGGAPVVLSSLPGGTIAAVGCPDGTLDVPIDGGDLAETTTFTLTLYRTDDDEPHAREDVTVTLARPEVRLHVTPPEVAKGQEAVLSWLLSGAEALRGRITSEDGDEFAVIDVPATVQTPDEAARSVPIALGQVPVKLDRTTAYAISIETVDEPKMAFVANAIGVVRDAVGVLAVSDEGPIAATTPPTEVVLTWEAAFAATATLRDTRDFRDGIKAVESGTIAASGTLVVRPLRDTTYTLEVTGQSPSPAQSKTVQVCGVDIRDFAVRNRSEGDWGDRAALTRAGDFVALRFTIAYATEAFIEVRGRGPNWNRPKVLWPPEGTAFAPDGPMSVSVDYVQVFNDVTFVLTAVGPNGPISRSLDVSLHSEARIETFDVIRSVDVDTGGRILMLRYNATATKVRIGHARPDRFPCHNTLDWDEHRVEEFLEGVTDYIQAENEGTWISGELSLYEDRSDMAFYQPETYDTTWYLMAWIGGATLPRIAVATYSGSWDTARPPPPPSE